jgi:hypothetical protein
MAAADPGRGRTEGGIAATVLEYLKIRHVLFALSLLEWIAYRKMN